MLENTQGAPFGGAEPWHGEPDRVTWRDPSTGLTCLILRGPLGALCGYVRVPRGHPLHGMRYTRRAATRLHVHGGLTFSGCLGGRRMRRGHWFGFDCAHADDLVPGMVLRFAWMQNGWGTYRAMEYVRAECTALAEQLARKAQIP